MCRLLGYAAPVPRTVASVLGGAQSRVFLDMAKLHRDGWGSAWIDDSGDVDLESVRQNTSGLEDQALLDALTRFSSKAKLIHLRLATGGMACEPQNTHPFVSGNIAFAHNGSFTDLSTVESLLSPTVLATIKGDTDSERYFGLIRTYREQGLSLPDATIKAVSILRELFPQSSLNALILSDDELIAVHASSAAPSPIEEFDKRGISAEELPADHVDSYYLMRMKQRVDGTVVFASSGLDIDDWDPLPADSVTTVDLTTLRYSTHAL
jgi:predicted glutamine amidotransferase